MVRRGGDVAPAQPRRQDHPGRDDGDRERARRGPTGPGFTRQLPQRYQRRRPGQQVAADTQQVQRVAQGPHGAGPTHGTDGLQDRADAVGEGPEDANPNATKPH